MAQGVRAAIEALYRTESRRVLATLIRLLGDFDRAEEALHEAFAAAAATWPDDGVPASPRAWLISTGRFKAIDALRRKARFEAPLADAEREEGAVPSVAPPEELQHLPDDDLRLVFTCCHPALAPDAQVALTLREVCGLATEEIARAFLTGAPTVAQRIVRAKAKIREAAIPYEVPPRAELPARLGIVLRVVYLVFNEGYSPTRGEGVTRADLAAEAIRLGRLLVDLLPLPEVEGLLALMLLQDARRAARTAPDGELVLLADQDRTRWDAAQIAEGVARVERALASGAAGPFTVQAAIAAVHAQARRAEETDWAEIVGLYDALLRLEPSPVVALNRAVAVAMRDGPAAGLPLVDALLAEGTLAGYHLAHAARGDLCRRLGRKAEAAEAYRAALALAQQEPERRFLRRRLAELGAG